MQRFGFNVLIVLVVIFVGTGTSCAGKIYHEDDMARLSTMVRTTMSIVKGKFYEKTMPYQINEDKIVEIVRNENSRHFKELNQLDGRIELMIVSDGTYMGAIIWDSDNNRKLIQDLQCTLKLDDPTWQREEFGNEFTLDWKICLVR
ncbi:MAG: hypothetical protein NUV55_01985 [Sulfuricaulis sp.]|uniref:hypothetical protein n=1 Tax=Sulfuricaulis sp. TaxID=2003553 RepID=UPI0025CE8C04|nr:hypothetical protein [Sulfuricaulis sp.]MCR4345967.1 hypothetical protein [Sulfuricaulis sp.]